MALWGTADSLYSVGTVTVNYSTKQVVGSATSFTAVGISTGDVITIGAGGTFGSAVISGITSDRLISIATTQYLRGAVISGVAYTLSERPVYTLEDSNYSSNVVGLTSTVPTHNIYGVDIYEMASLTPGNSGLATQYGGFHAGWVGIHTYIDMHGNLRVKSETLVAMSGITTLGQATFTAAGDALDDSIFPDRYITITTQPVSLVGVSTTSTQSFSVVASATPDATLAYQWQYSSNAGVAYTAITSPLNNVVYTGTTGTTLGIGSTTVSANRPDGYYYRVGVSTTGVETVFSNGVILDYA
jgi:hypothetical protein